MTLNTFPLIFFAFFGHNQEAGYVKEFYFTKQKSQRCFPRLYNKKKKQCLKKTTKKDSEWFTKIQRDSGHSRNHPSCSHSVSERWWVEPWGSTSWRRWSSSRRSLWSWNPAARLWPRPPACRSQTRQRQCRVYQAPDGPPWSPETCRGTRSSGETHGRLDRQSVTCWMWFTVSLSDLF